MTDSLQPPKPIGSIVAERYEVVAELGRGGMGCVYEARNTVTGRSVALKIPTHELASDASLRRRLLREARAAAHLSHPNVIDILDVVTGDDGVPVIVMELLEGASLAAVLGGERERGGTLSVEQAASYLVPVLDALHQAHQHGVVHRDFKPENVFVARRHDGRITPKLLDFGIAKVLEGSSVGDASATTTGAMLGTPYYMAPEQVGGQSDVDKRADVWAAGAVVFECLTGVRAFSGDNYGQIFTAIITGCVPSLRERVPGVPEAIAGAVASALTRDREARAADLAELIDALSPFVRADVPHGAPLSVRSGTNRDEPPRPADDDTVATPLADSAQFAHATTIGSGPKPSRPAAGAPPPAGAPERRTLRWLGLGTLAATGAGVVVWAALAGPSSGSAPASVPPVLSAAGAVEADATAPAPTPAATEAPAPSVQISASASAAVVVRPLPVRQVKPAPPPGPPSAASPPPPPLNPGGLVVEPDY